MLTVVKGARYNFTPWVRDLDPGCFAMVMATGVLSIDVNEHGMPTLARGLLALNALAFVWLLLLTSFRLLRFRTRMAEQFGDPGQGAAFLTLIAATCILGAQCVSVMDAPRVAAWLGGIGAVFWLVLMYAFLVVVIVQPHKQALRSSMNGSWLVLVVATQALAGLAIRLSDAGPNPVPILLLVGLCLFLLGGALYMLLITLVVYRLLFLPMRAREFTPPYWIEMGALAISALVAGLFVMHAPAHSPLALFAPFVSGLGLLFWALASWWIPLLIVLELWRHVWRKWPLEYSTDVWDVVFPIGMYTLSTFALATALGLEDLRTITNVAVWINLAVWSLAAFGMTRAMLRSVDD